jgi:drug/metabolite transporter (DMT)-like permease
MPPSQLLGVFFSVASALIWGTGDFLGGLASRRAGRYQIVALAAAAGLVLLLPAPFLLRDPPASGTDVIWSVAAGLAGALGIAALYGGLSTGRAAVVAPTAAVVSASLPLTLDIVREGSPDAIRLGGFLAGLAGIWLVSQPAADEKTAPIAHSLRLGMLAGVGFSGYFIFIAEVQPGRILVPLLLTKATAVVFALIVLRVLREPPPSPAALPLGIATGVFDAGGNLFYMLALQHTSLAVAAVLSSMYPGTTVLLSRIVLRERIARPQILGVAVCLLAVGLIAS